jgi:predicted acyltransferase
MNNTVSQGVSVNGRLFALDALRGLAMLAMLLSGQLPFGANDLPSWMYHAQEPPPAHEWIGTLPGITWVDLVFPFFLFSMGAAFPFALSRRIAGGEPIWRAALFILERGFLLTFFALFVQAIRPSTLSGHPTTAVWLLALLGFLILFPVLTRLPSVWPCGVRWSIRIGGWIGVALFFTFARYPDGSGFDLGRSDIIIVVLTNMAVFGSLVWMLTRDQLLPRLGVLGILFAIRLSNMPQPVDGWVHDLWEFSPAPWIYKLYYLQYLCIVIPGMIAGDLAFKWARASNVASGADANRGWPAWRLAVICILMFLFVLVLLIGLKARWLLSCTLITFGLCGLVYWLVSRPTNEIELLYKKLFCWAIYWLALGLFFEPYEGGIKKDKATMSYYFVTSGLAICVLIGLSIILDVFKRRRWLQLLIDNGQNPMIAYAGINNFITPLLALTGGDWLLTKFATTPWLGFGKGLIITLLMAITVSFLTRRKIFWRT